MTDTAPDVTETVAYGSDRMFLQSLPVALFLLLLGLSVLTFVADDLSLKEQFAVWVVIVAGLGLGGYTLYRRFNPSTPLITLSTIGIRFRMPFLKTIHMPWREIDAVGVRDVRSFFPSLVRPRFIHFNEVTTVRVSKAFYDRHIHVTSPFMRGPAWGNTYFPENDHVDIALHHEMLGIEAGELHDTILARWRAFSGRTGEFSPVLAPMVVARRRRKPLFPWTVALDPRLSDALNFVKYAVPVAGILFALSNLLGLWEAGYQREARDKRAEWQAQLKKWDDEEKKSAEERRQREKDWDEFWKKHKF